MDNNIHKFPKTHRSVINNLLKAASKNEVKNPSLAIEAYGIATTLLIKEVRKLDKMIISMLKDVKQS